MTVVFENRDTMRFQIQEMARVERLLTDEAIQPELDTYNTLIPETGQLCATCSSSSPSDDRARGVAAKLVGDRALDALRVARAHDALRRGPPEAAHAEQLTHDDMTASVHYVFWELDPDEVAAVARNPVTLVIDHPAYQEETSLAAETLDELRADLRG